MPIHHVTAETVEDIGVGLRIDGRLEAFIPVDEASRLAWELMDAVQSCRKSDEAKGLDPNDYRVYGSDLTGWNVYGRNGLPVPGHCDYDYQDEAQEQAQRLAAQDDPRSDRDA